MTRPSATTYYRPVPSLRRTALAALLTAMTGAPLCLALPAAASPAANADTAPQRGQCPPADAAQLGQLRIDQGRYEDAVALFSCVLRTDPHALDGYRGRAEAQLLLGRFSAAMADYARITAQVLPTRPDAFDDLRAAYRARLSRRPDDQPALTGASFAAWWAFDYAATLPLLRRLLALRPGDLYGTLYRGSNRLFLGDAGGAADLTRAILLAPHSADVRFIVADAYTYAQPDPARAQAEATLALSLGLDTPRVQAILASAAFALGDPQAGAAHLERHIALSTSDHPSIAPLAPGSTVSVDLIPGRSYDIPLVLAAGQALSIRTSSPSGEIDDSVAVLLAPDGTPVAGNDDLVGFYAGLDWTAPQAGTYSLRVTSFEGVGTGDLVVRRE